HDDEPLHRARRLPRRPPHARRRRALARRGGRPDDARRPSPPDARHRLWRDRPPGPGGAGRLKNRLDIGMTPNNISDAPVIAFDRVTLAYAGRTIVSDLSLAVGRGEIVCIIGPSGCGKTTALRMAGGLVKPDAGAVRLLGEKLAQP